MSILRIILLLFRALFRDRSQLALENLALRQQLAILRRKAPRPRLRRADRGFWVSLIRVCDQWRLALILVRPETVLHWHHRGFRYFWRWKSTGRPCVNPELIRLIRRMSQENPLWGAPRIRSELLLLGYDIAESTVAKYTIRRGRRPPSKSWRTFLRNHLRHTAACDFFVVPTATFRLLFCFVILSHDRRRILRFSVTAHPTAVWTAQQIGEAFPGDGTKPRYLLRDRDGAYSDECRRVVWAIGIREILTAPQSPWQDPYAERVIGPIRSECLDHLIILNENHLRRISRSTSGTTTSRGRTFPWKGMRPSRGMWSSRHKVPSWRFPMSAVCITATLARPDLPRLTRSRSSSRGAHPFPVRLVRLQ